MPPCHGGGRGFESRPVRKEPRELDRGFFMPHYVYIIESFKDGTFYKGESATPLSRLHFHNAGMNKSTASHVPWKLVYLKEFSNRISALKEEKRLKRTYKDYLRWLIQQKDNIMLDNAALSRLA